nr:hypothetical protein [uncultured Cohaesibacter sp.]
MNSNINIGPLSKAGKLTLVAGFVALALTGCKTTSSSNSVGSPSAGSGSSSSSGSTSGSSSGSSSSGSSSSSSGSTSGSSSSGTSGNVAAASASNPTQNGSGETVLSGFGSSMTTTTLVRTAGAATVTAHDDDTTTFLFTSGTYAGQTLVLDADGNGTLNGKPVMMENLGADGTAAESALLTIGDPDSSDESYVAAYAISDTAKLPASGTATYSGTMTGVGISGANSGYASGDVSVSANFGTGAVSGTFSNLAVTDEGTNYAVGSNVAFSGTMNTSTATYSADSITLGGTAADPVSHVAGVFGGDGATATAGELYVADDFANPTKAVYGVYQADKD